MDDEGFFHTEDIGEMDVWGQLKIIDRKKSLFKLSQGMILHDEHCSAAMQTAASMI